MSQIHKLSNIMPNLIQAATESTIKSQLAAALIKGQKMMSRPCANTPRNMCRGQTCGSLHAEAHAMLDFFGRDLSYSHKGWSYSPTKSGKNIRGKQLDLVVIRIKSDNTLGNSRPCYNCLNMMKAVNIKRIYYIDKDGDMVSEFVKDMVSIHASSVARHIHTIKTGLKDESLTEYFENLLKTYFPAEIRKTNFSSFVEHDLFTNLPEHSYLIKNECGTNIVYILDADKEIIASSKLVN